AIAASNITEIEGGFCQIGIAHTVPVCSPAETCNFVCKSKYGQGETTIGECDDDLTCNCYSPCEGIGDEVATAASNTTEDGGFCQIGKAHAVHLCSPAETCNFVCKLKYDHGETTIIGECGDDLTCNCYSPCEGIGIPPAERIG
ncbi:unnamed protein product, partial [Linum tenue]